MVIVHLTTVVEPAVTPVTVLVGDDGVVTTPGPLWMLHAPLPGAAALPASVNVVVLHKLWSAPAFAVGAGAVLVSTMSSNVVGHVPLPTVHRSVALEPAAIPVIVVVGEVALVIVAVPAKTVHVPVPTVGTAAFIVNVLVLHCVMLATPASATLGVS